MSSVGCVFGVLGRIGVVLAAVAIAIPLPAQRQQQQRRNVIFILSDDHRHDFMSFVKGAPVLNAVLVRRLAR